MKAKEKNEGLPLKKQNQNECILSINNLIVKFKVRSKVLTAIRDVSLNVTRGETLAIVGESGSGKSVLTKTFTNMLETNGYISNGSIIYYPEPGEKIINLHQSSQECSIDLVAFHRNTLSNDAMRQINATNRNQIKDIVSQLKSLDEDDIVVIKEKMAECNRRIAALKNKMDFKGHNNRLVFKISRYEEQANMLMHRCELLSDAKSKTEHIKQLNKKRSELENELKRFCRINFVGKILLGKYVCLANRIVKDDAYFKSNVWQSKVASILKISETHQERVSETWLLLLDVFKKLLAKNLVDQHEIDFLNEAWQYERRFGFLTKNDYRKNLKKLRGGVVATIFQDPMTSLNPLLTVGYQIIEVLRLHQNMGWSEAHQTAVQLLNKVGIVNPEKRMRDLPGKYSGGMRQRVVIAVALACRPKILICDEPTTALDVTIQAQILELIKSLKREYNLTIIFITHDLGVVANIADRVVVFYAGQIVEYGMTKEIFFNSQHPYTWSLLSSLPQLGIKGEELFSIPGTPPSLFNAIKGDSFAPRNRYALAVDYLYEPPMFSVSPTHGAKTWLLDPRAPKVQMPKQLAKLNGLNDDIDEEGWHD